MRIKHVSIGSAVSEFGDDVYIVLDDGGNDVLLEDVEMNITAGEIGGDSSIRAIGHVDFNNEVLYDVRIGFGSETACVSCPVGYEDEFLSGSVSYADEFVGNKDRNDVSVWVSDEDFVGCEDISDYVFSRGGDRDAFFNGGVD